MQTSGRSPANEALADAEAVDGYRRAVEASEVNRYARRNDTYEADFLYNEDLTALMKEMDEIELMNNTEVVILHSTADNGYPHTRAPNRVCMPTRVITESTATSLAETLRHEAVHIHQRRNPALWAAACAREGWWPLPQGQIPLRFRERCRINPDTYSPQQFWSWESSRYVPLPLFTSEYPDSLASIAVKWLDIRSGTLFSDPPDSFQARYGTAPSQPEHPFELLAVEAAKEGLTTHQGIVRKLMGT